MKHNSRKSTLRRIPSLILAALMVLSILVPSASYAETKVVEVSTEPVANKVDEYNGFYKGDVYDIDYKLPKDDGEDINTDSLRPSTATATQRFYFAPGEGMATPVRDQKKYGTCWAFAMIGGMESSILNQASTIDGGVHVDRNTLDLSELHFAYFHYNTERDPLGNFTGDLTAIGPTDNSYLTLGGSNMYSSFSLMAWKAGAKESVAPYSSITGKYHPVDQNLYSQKTAHVQNFYWVDMNNIDLVKQMIVRYGAVVIQYKHMGVFYNANTASYYCNDAGMVFGGHAVLVVGWSDDLSRYSFNDDPGRNGAWIVKNSWGTDWGMTSPGAEGCYWMSYYDAPLRTMPGVVVDAWDGDTYDNNYQYDGTSCTKSLPIPASEADPTRIAASYEVKANEYERLDAISAAFNSTNVNYSLQIYKRSPGGVAPDDGEPMLDTPVTGQTGLVGYYTIALNQEVVLRKGEVYSIVLSIWHSSGNVSIFVDRTDSADYWCMFRNLCSSGQTFFAWGQNAGWADLAQFVHPAARDYTDGYNLRIKGYTNDVEPIDFEIEGLTVEGRQDFARKNHPYAFSLIPDEGNALPDSVIITCGGQTLVEDTDYTYNNSDGYIYINNVADDIVVTAAGAETVCAHNYVPAVTTEATCDEAGVMTYTCSKCGDTYSEEIPALGHDFGEWEDDPTDEFGEKRVCSRCGYAETRDKQGSIFARKYAGYKVDIKNLDPEHGYTIRYATGDYNSVSDLKNGANADFIMVVGTDEARIELPTDGQHTVMIQDRSNNNALVYIGKVTIDQDDIESEIDYDMTDAFIKVNNLKGARKVQLLDEDGNIVSSAARFTTDGLKYWVVLEAPCSGTYTVKVFYEDGAILWDDEVVVAVPEPTVSANGRVYTVRNYTPETVSYMRVAKGEYSSASEMKTAADLRTYGAKYFRDFTAAFAALDAQNGETAAYTAQIMFRSGYSVFVTFEVTPTLPTVTVEDGKIVVGNALNERSYIDWVRYAPGELSTLTQVRKTRGSKIVTTADIVDGRITIDVDPGVYTLYYLYDGYDLSEGLVTVNVQ
ncbi:MAG: hypothetical protein IJT91_05195 [Clostridia bacterium]|nr:hypothetical protein [Clostridia bacterium]